MLTSGEGSYTRQEGSFRKWKSCPNEENKQEHKHCQKKHMLTIKDVKKDYDVHMAKTARQTKNSSNTSKAENLPGKQLEY